MPKVSHGAHRRERTAAERGAVRSPCRKGETIEITKRGRSIARLISIASGSTFDRLVAEGRVGEARGWMDGLPTPLPAEKGIRRFVKERATLTSSILARDEVLRAARQRGLAALRRSRAVISRISPVRLDDALIDSAAALDPMPLRTLDAIHLASAMMFGDELDVLVTYDALLLAAAEALGMPAVGPT